MLTIVSNIDKTKFEPIVVLPNDGPLTKKLDENGVRYKIISYPIIRRKYFNITGILNYIREYRTSCKKICEFAKEEKIDVIHNNTIAVIEGITVKKKLNIPLIFHIHEMIEHPKFVAKKLYKMAVKNSDKVVVVSESVKKHIISLTKIKTSNIEVVHNGITPIKSEASRQKYLEEFGFPNDSVVFAVIGRINAIKGQDHFVDAFKNISQKIDNVYGLIIGDAFSGQEWRVTTLIDKLEKENLKQKLIYCGFREDIKDLFSLIDVLVLPSIGYDSFPTVVLEAMSCGVPIVAYRCGGVEEMVENQKNGILIAQHNIMELSDSLMCLATDEVFRNKLGKEAQKKYNDNYTMDIFIEKIQRIYER